MKLRITDEDGKAYEVEEVVETTDEDKVVEETKVEDDPTEASTMFTPEEIAALKALAAQFVAKENPATETTDECSEDCDTQDSEDGDDEDEESAKSKANDSKSAFGSLEQAKKLVEDADTTEEAIAAAWANRGKRK